MPRKLVALPTLPPWYNPMDDALARIRKIAVERGLSGGEVVLVFFAGLGLKAEKKPAAPAGMNIETIIASAGGPAAVAKLFGIRSQAVSQWTRVPADRCIALEEHCSGSITRHDMRPDIFGARPSEQARAA